MVLSRSWFLIEPGISPQHVEEILAPFSAAVHSQCSLQREGVDVHIVDMHQEEKHDLVSACCFRADYRKGILIFRNMANDTDPERAYRKWDTSVGRVQYQDQCHYTISIFSLSIVKDLPSDIRHDRVLTLNSACGSNWGNLLKVCRSRVLSPSNIQMFPF